MIYHSSSYVIKNPFHCIAPVEAVAKFIKIRLQFFSLWCIPLNHPFTIITLRWNNLKFCLGLFFFCFNFLYSLFNVLYPRHLSVLTFASLLMGFSNNGFSCLVPQFSIRKARQRKIPLLFISMPITTCYFLPLLRPTFPSSYPPTKNSSTFTLPCILYARCFLLPALLYV